MSNANARASLWIWSLQQEKLGGFTTGMNLSDFPAKFCTKPGMSAALTLTVCTRLSRGLLASVDQLTLLACGAEKAPISISVSLSQKEQRLGLCLLPPLVNLGFGCSCGLCRFVTLVSCPRCCCQVQCCCLDHDLCLCLCGSCWGKKKSFGRHCCCLSLNSWHAGKSLKSPSFRPR